jgi:diguanylate cyclase (GGDEF)-like protein
VEITAFASGGVALLCVLAVLVALRALHDAWRRAYVWLCVGMAASAVSLLVTAVVAHGSDMAPPVAWTAAVGGTVAAVPFVIGLLDLLGPDAGTRARLRHGLDGFILGSNIFFVGWITFIALAGDPLTPGLTARFLVIALPAAVAAWVAGLAVMSAARAIAPRRLAILTSTGVALAAGGGLSGVLVCCFPEAVHAGVTVVATSLGFLCVAVAAALVGRSGVAVATVAERQPNRVWLTLCVGAAVVGGGYEVTTAGRLAAVSAIAAAAVVLSLFARLTIALRDVSGHADKLEVSEKHFRLMAYTDPLTGLGNRRRLTDLLRREDPDRAAVSILAIDLDGFKNINDLHGHEVGDAVLHEVGKRLRASIRPGDVAVRLGGDEFAVLTWAREDVARTVADRLLTVLAKPYQAAEVTVDLSASIGLASGGPLTVFRHADVALRVAKQGGKARVEHYDSTYDGWIRRRVTLEQGLRRAIARGELSLSYQPVVSLPAGRPVGVEALLRWHHAELGPVTPGEFIPVAEEIGMIGALGRWTVHEACHQLSLWLAEGHDLWLAVNVSVRELRGLRYADHVAEVLREHHVPPHRLVLEVTEQSVADDIEELARPLAALRELGVRVALDDFGSGYSSLGQLWKLPVDVIKIDRELVTEPARPGGGGVTATAAGPLVDIVVQLGERLGLQVVAEGVEDDDQRMLVERAGCHLGQGYLFGRAMPAERVEALLVEAAAHPAVDPTEA